MDFGTSEDLDTLRELARKILAESTTPERLRGAEESADGIDPELWRALAEANLLGVEAPDAHGGMGFGLAESCVVLEEIGRAVAPVPAFATMALAVPVLNAFGTDAQREAWLPAIARGERVWTAALGETAEPRVRARREGAGWVLDGEVALVSAARLAERILVPARTADGDTQVLAVPRASSGVRTMPVRTLDLQARDHLALSSVEVPDTDRIGDDGDAVHASLRQRAALATCALQVGVCERALAETADYASERKQFGRPIGSFQAVHTRAADAFIDLQAITLTYWRARHLVATGDPEAEEALTIARFWASEAGSRIVAATQHLHGGIGVDIDYPVHRTFLWARQLSLERGGAGTQLSRLGESFVR